MNEFFDTYMLACAYACSRIHTLVLSESQAQFNLNCNLNCSYDSIYKLADMIYIGHYSVGI